VGTVALIDRLAERQALDGALDAARNGLSAAFVVRGEPGVGKTSLLDYAVESATAFRVVRIVGVESEIELPYAGLHRLLIPFLAARHRLPQRQRDALGSAFGLVDGTPADRFFVGLAALSLLDHAAVDALLLCVVDDAQWLDQESLEALAVVGRRLHADRIVLLFGLREGQVGRAVLDGIADIRIAGLPDDAAELLLTSVVRGPLDRAVAKRIVGETRGWPMAIIELADELSAKELSGGLPPEPLPLGRRLEEHFLSQIRNLPPATQTLLLVAAAEPSGDPRLLAEAAERLGSSAAAAEPAQAEGVFVMSPEPRFRHPLIRSAVYGGAEPAERRRVHEALAAASDPDRDPDRRAWHLAAAATVPNAAIATDLEHAAGRARDRGGYSAAGTFLAKAAQLTPDGRLRAERLLAAAHAHLTGGAPGRARTLLEETAHLGDAFQRARAQRLDGAIRYALGETQGTVSVFVNAARALEPFDIHLARATMLEALSAARIPGRFAAPGESEIDVARAARAMHLPPDHPPTIADLLLDGDTALFLDGHAAAVPFLRRAIAALQIDDSDTADAMQLLWIGCWAAGAIGDDAALQTLATRLEHSARDRGALVPLSVGLLFLAMSELLDGSLEAARTHLSERTQIMAAMGRPSDVLTLVVLAWEGRETEARAEASAVVRFAAEQAQGWVLAFVNYALAVLELGLGHYAEALTSATKNYRENPFLTIVGSADLIEAACRCGQRAIANEAAEEFAARAVPNGTPIALGLLALSKALMADDADAEKFYQAAIEHLSRCRGKLRTARARLLYGEWLRRHKRRLDARYQLREAHNMFLEMGAAAFANRARTELAATGERARKRSDATRNQLTPQEEQIAVLASRGATNPEIAARLFLSASTVDYHLKKVYRKLDITSRRQLGRALPA
jgi:DNA-binding CsgD family transcriptional regulator